MIARFAAVLLGLALVPTVSAQGLVERFQAGTHYFPIEPAQPTPSDTIEVIEAFSYGCIHCANFQPMVDRWKASKPEGTSFVYLPAAFRPDFALLAQGYYAAEALGVVDKTHQPLFNAIFVERKPIRTLEDLADFYAGHGVNRDEFLAAARSFAVQTKVQQGNRRMASYGVEGTPAIVVAGKYRITGASAGGWDKVFDVVNFLVAKEAAARKAGGA